MPVLRLDTNLPAHKIPGDLPEKLTQFIVKELNKPVEFCVVVINPGLIMSWAGVNVPQVQLSLASIGALDVEDNKRYSKILADLIEKELGIPSDRMYISYVNLSTRNVGYKGTTFHETYGDVERL